MASPAIQFRNFGRFLGRVLVLVSILLVLLSGYVAFAHHWIQTQWVKSEATVLSSEVRQRSSGSVGSAKSTNASSTLYFARCTVSYPVAGEARQSQLDSPASPYTMDAQVWAGSWSPRRHLAILYEPSNPSVIRLPDNPAEITATGTLRVALYLFIPGMLLKLISRPERTDFS